VRVVRVRTNSLEKITFQTRAALSCSGFLFNPAV
jgi:hypothetical protein